VDVDARADRVYNELALEGRISDREVKGTFNGGGPRIKVRGGKVTHAEI
jgi:hypothetical protein